MVTVHFLGWLDGGLVTVHTDHSEIVLLFLDLQLAARCGHVIARRAESASGPAPTIATIAMQSQTLATARHELRTDTGLPDSVEVLACDDPRFVYLIEDLLTLDTDTR
ncbi:hypothetical protein [Nocardia beijingensis]